jgi:LuxR family quorum-sensing transcriptional regulator LasR
MVKEEHCTFAAARQLEQAARQSNTGIDVLQLTSDIMRLNQCEHFAQVDDALAAISTCLGFDHYLYEGRFKIGNARYVEHIATNYSAAWRERYVQQGFIHVDPTFAYARSSLCPLVWNPRMYATQDQQAFWQEAQAHGLAAGVTLPIHSRNGDFARVNLSLSRGDDAARDQVCSKLKWGALLAALTHEAMGRVVRANSVTSAPKLSKREAEVLQWIAEGKSNWDISRLVGISEHGVSHHVRNLLLKFDVASRHLAVAKAGAWGLLHHQVVTTSRTAPRPDRTLAGYAA